MRLRSLSAALAFFTALSGPALAVPSVTLKVQTQNSGNHALTSSSQTFTANRYIVVTGFMRMLGTTDIIVVSGSVSGAMTVRQCSQSTGGATPTNGNAFIAYVKAVGGAETVTAADGAGSDVANSIVMQVLEVDGIPASSPEDTSAYGCNGTPGATATPSTTSGAPSIAGDMFISVYGSNSNAGTLVYTEDVVTAWTLLGGTGNSNIGSWASWFLNTGSGAQIHAPLTTSRAYAMSIAGFKDAAVPASTYGGGTTIGVGH